MTLFVGVDLGTQSVKAGIVQDDGEIVAEGRVPLTSHRDGPRHEQDADAWVGATRDAIAMAVSTLPVSRRREIRSIAVCSTSGTVVTIASDGTRLTPGIMYDDARAASYVDAVFDADPVLWGRLGYRPQPSWAITKLAWLRDYGFLPPGSRIAHQGDVVVEAMAGHPVATDWSTALKTGYDTHSLCWPETVFEKLGIDLSALPSVVGPGTELGVVSDAWQEQTGLPAGTRILAGMTDGCAAQLGVGALGIGDWHSIIGTTLVLKGVSLRPVNDDAGVVYSHRAPHDELWLPGGASSVGAGVLTELLRGADAGQAIENGAHWLRDARMPLCYPLIGVGERFPIVRPDAMGFVVDGGRSVGLEEFARRADLADASHDASDGDGRLAAAVAFGVACVERLSLDVLAAAGASTNGRFSSSGGGTRSAVWTQLRADLLGRGIALPASSEAWLGMAILAAWGDRQDDSATLPGIAADMSRIALTIEPDSRRHEILSERYDAFLGELRARRWVD